MPHVFRFNCNSLQDRVREERRERTDKDRRRFNLLCPRSDNLRVRVIYRSLFSRNLRFEVAGGFLPKRISRVNHVYYYRHINNESQVAMSAKDFSHVQAIVYFVSVTATRGDNYACRVCGLFLRYRLLFYFYMLFCFHVRVTIVRVFPFSEFRFLLRMLRCRGRGQGGGGLRSRASRRASSNNDARDAIAIDACARHRRRERRASCRDRQYRRSEA